MSVLGEGRAGLFRSKDWLQTGVLTGEWYAQIFVKPAVDREVLLALPEAASPAHPLVISAIVNSVGAAVGVGVRVRVGAHELEQIGTATYCHLPNIAVDQPCADNTSAVVASANGNPPTDSAVKTPLHIGWPAGYACGA